MSLQKSSASRLRVLFPLGYCAALFIVSSIPGGMEQQDRFGHAWLVNLSPLVQNLLHVPAFAGLAWAWVWALEGWRVHRPGRLALAFLLTLIYAGLDEWRQSFVPERSASLLDLVLDLAGAAIGVLIASRTAARAPS